MATPNLPTDIAAGTTTTGHKADTDTVHAMLNRFDDADGTTDEALVWDGTAWVSAVKMDPPVGPVEDHYVVALASGHGHVRPPFRVNTIGTNQAAARLDADVNEWRIDGEFTPDNMVNGDKLIINWVA